MIPDWWEAVLLALASWRTFWLAAEDEILAAPRRHVTERWLDWLSCEYCFGFWVAVAWWGAWLVFPYETLVFAVPWALSAGVIAVSKVLSSD